MKTAQTIHPGDVITAAGRSFTVSEILFQDCYHGLYDVEFIDASGRYHHWKQEHDGGTVAHSAPEMKYIPD